MIIVSQERAVITKERRSGVIRLSYNLFATLLADFSLFLILSFMWTILIYFVVPFVTTGSWFLLALAIFYLTLTFTADIGMSTLCVFFLAFFFSFSSFLIFSLKFI